MIDLDKLEAVVDRRAANLERMYDGGPLDAAQHDADGDAMLEAVPALIAELRQAREDVRRLREALARLADACIPAGSYSPTLAAARAVLAETEGSRG